MEAVSTVRWTEQEHALLLPSIGPDASKYTRGSLLVAGGSARYTGAPILAARAAARTGAGYTSLMVPADMESIARAHVLSIPVIGAPSIEGMFRPGAAMIPGEQLGHLDALVAGPGMGVSDATAGFIARLLDGYDVPVVLDADALNVVAGRNPIARAAGRPGDALRALQSRAGRGAATVLTPHDGELKRLLVACGCADDGAEDEDISAARLRRAAAVAEATGAVVVAKGRQTLIVCEGRPALISAFGSPVLAKAGTGDVLAGIIGSLCAQGLSAYEASGLGVFIHAKAGEHARAMLGMHAPMAEDVIEGIAPAIKALEESFD